MHKHEFYLISLIEVFKEIDLKTEMVPSEQRCYQELQFQVVQANKISMFQKYVPCHTEPQSAGIQKVII